jgi:hypothetical protein
LGVRESIMLQASSTHQVPYLVRKMLKIDDLFPSPSG